MDICGFRKILSVICFENYKIANELQSIYKSIVQIKNRVGKYWKELKQISLWSRSKWNFVDFQEWHLDKERNKERDEDDELHGNDDIEPTGFGAYPTETRSYQLGMLQKPT